MTFLILITTSQGEQFKTKLDGSTLFSEVMARAIDDTADVMQATGQSIKTVEVKQLSAWELAQTSNEK